MEFTLNQMRNETTKYTRTTQKEKQASDVSLKEELQELIAKEESLDNITACNNKQDEISTLEEKKLYDILSKKQNVLLLEDEHPTSQQGWLQ